MFACLMAAMMSSADAYMLVTSALIVRNLYAAYLRPAATDRECVAVGRLTSVVLIAGAVGVALRWADVFGQFKMAIEIPILFAAPFWVGLYWRRATRAAVWGTMAFSAIVFFILPLLLPLLKPGWRSDPRYTLATPVAVTSIERPAAPVDVARWQHWRSAEEDAQKASDPAARAEALRRIGPAPPQAETVGQSITVPSRSGGQAIFWRDGLAGDAELELIERRREGAETIEVFRAGGSRRGKGSFQLDLAFYSWLGWDLSRTRAATLETLRLPPRLVAPFAVLVLLSLVTRPNRREVLDRYYAKMKTEVRRDPEADRRALEEAYADPRSLEGLKLFPHSSFEFLRPRAKDIVGVVVSVAICLAIVGLLMALAVIGS